MKSTSIERYRQSQQLKREEKLKARQLKNAPVVSKEEPTHFELDGQIYEYNYLGFSKALFKGLLLLVLAGVSFIVIIAAIYFFSLMIKGTI